MVRDIDKLRTRSEFRLGPRHLALIIFSAAVGAGMLLVVGNALARGDDEGETATRPDPLAALESAPAEGESEPVETASAAEPGPAAREETPGAPVTDTPPLTFHERLAAPALPPSPLPIAPPADDAMAPLTADEPVVPLAPPTAAHHNIPLLAPAPAAPPVAAAPPAPVAAAAVPETTPLPPISADAAPRFDEEPTPDLAQPGERGVFTLQVASYYTQDEAVTFMNSLRQRGHESFLVRADGGERGTIWRVRVGPFGSHRDAERYRRTFERAERVPTFVVRRRLPSETEG